MRRPISVDAEPAFRTAQANPYNSRLYTAVGALGVPVREFSYARLLLSPPSIVHLHWPELTFLSGPRRWRHIARLVLFFGFFRIARLRGTRLVWTVHNLNSHEERSSRRIRAGYRFLLLRNVDAFMSLSKDGIAATRAMYPELENVPGYVTPHGHYRLDYDLTGDRTDARIELSIPGDARLIVSMGSLRAYKNIPALIRSYLERDDDGSVLAVAGKPSSDELRREIEAAARKSDRVRLELSFLSPARMALWLRAADMVVLPYRDINNSGSAILALSANRPVLVPDLGAMGELANLVGDNWVRLYDGDITRAELDRSMVWLNSTPRPESTDLSSLSWGTIAARTVDVYSSVATAPRPYTAPKRRAKKDSGTNKEISDTI